MAGSNEPERQLDRGDQERHLRLRPMTSEDLRSVAPWFDDPETRRRLGGPDWPERLLSLAATAPTSFPDLPVRERHALLGLIDDEPVALLDLEIYEDLRAGVALIVAPKRRRRGIGLAALRALAARSRELGVHTLLADAEGDHVESQRLLLRAGFQRTETRPDRDGFLEFALSVSQQNTTVGRV